MGGKPWKENKMDKKEAARKAAEVQDRVARFARELMTEAYGETGTPEWGTLFTMNRVEARQQSNPARSGTSPE